MEEDKTFKGFTDSQRHLDRNQFFQMLKGDRIHAALTLSWKKSLDSGIVIPKKVR